MHPGCAQGQGQGQRSRDTSTFGISQKSLTQPFPNFSFLCPFGFIPHPNPQIVVCLRCEFRHISHGETIGTRRPSLRKGYARKQCVYIRRPLAKKSKLSHLTLERNITSVLYTAGVMQLMLLYVWECEECRLSLSLLTYLLIYVAVHFLRQICFSTFAETIMSENFRLHANTEIVIKLIYLSLIVFPVLFYWFWRWNKYSLISNQDFRIKTPLRRRGSSGSNFVNVGPTLSPTNPSASAGLRCRTKTAVGAAGVSARWFINRTVCSPNEHQLMEN